MDGIYEYLDMQITIPIEKNASVFGFHLFLLFEYKLLVSHFLQINFF